MKFKCLLVDDEPLALDVLESYIRRVDGLELVARCDNALQAFDLIQSQPIDFDLPGYPNAAPGWD